MNQKYLGGRNMGNSVTGTGHHVLGLQARDTGGRKWTEFLMDHDSHCKEKPKANFKAGTKGSGLCFLKIFEHMMGIVRLWAERRV